MWCETAVPDVKQAQTFAEGIHKHFPDKLLAYNCSPSFNWKQKLDDATIAKFQRELGAMGYKFQFVTLAGFHALNFSMFELARGYKERQMSAYVELQQAEFSAEKAGYTATRHQREVGAGYFDDVTQTVTRRQVFDHCTDRFDRGSAIQELEATPELIAAPRALRCRFLIQFAARFSRRRITMKYDHIVVPADGERITLNPDFSLKVPDRPIVPSIEGDGIGIDVTPVMKKVVDAAVAKAYGDERRIVWMEIYAGEKSNRIYGAGAWFPEETLQAMRDFVVSIKGPLGTPVGGGIRSLNVAIRQQLDLYACVRPIRHFPGVSTPMKDSSQVEIVVFRENTEDIYAGIEWPAGSPEVQKLIAYLHRELGVTSIRFPSSSAIGIKPVSKEGSQRLIRKAIQYAVDNDRFSVTLVHKGNIMKFTEGGFRNWGYQLARDEFGAQEIDKGPWLSFKNPLTGHNIVIKDVIADNFLQQALLRPEEYDLIATLNLNGDYISDALAAQVGGHRDRAGRQYRRWARRVRGDAWHRPWFCRQGSREPRLDHPVSRNDAALPALDGGGGSHHQRSRQHDCQPRAHLRSGAPAGSDPRTKARARRPQERGRGFATTHSRRDAGWHAWLWRRRDSSHE